MAVYTEITEFDLRHFLTQFDTGELVSFEGIAQGVENTNYKVTTSTGRYILTLIEKRASAKELPFCIGFMEHLHGKGLRCPAVIRSRNDLLINSFHGKPAILSEFLEGGEIKNPQPRHLAEVGGTLAVMHLEGQSYPERQHNNMALPAWKTLISACHDKADTIEAGLGGFLQERLAFIEKNMPRLLPKGAIHADLFPDNVFFDGDKISGIIDFYFSCTDTLVYDLMLTLNAWCFDAGGIINIEKAATFLQHYQRLRPLSAAEITTLPFFGQAAALRIVATRLYDWLHPIDGALVRQKDPLEHLRILRFHMHAQSSAAYGLAA